MEALLSDVRYGLRLLLRQPGVAVVALVTLAFGVGANSAIFSVVNGVLLRPLPYPVPSGLFMVWQDHTRREGPANEWASPDNFFDWRDQNEVFQGMFAFSSWTPTLTGVDEPEQLAGAQVSHDAFSILGVAPAVGRSFRPDEDRAGAPPVVILSHALWQRRFSGDRSIVGSSLRLGDQPAEIVGVLPPGFEFPLLQSTDIYSPLAIDRSNSCGRGCVTLRVIGRLTPGVPLARARSDMDAIAARLERDYPEENSGVGVDVVSLHEQVVGAIRPALLVLLASVALVLLIACANVASLLLARAADREREVATRVAMGASRGRLLRQMLTESLVLAVLGAGLGVLLALWGVDVIRSAVSSDVPRFAEVEIDGRVLSFTSFVALLTGLLFGVVPALRGSNPNLQRSLKEGSRGSTAAAASRVRSLLVVGEVALALTLLVGASLLIRSFDSLMRVDPGFDARNVLTAGLSLASARYEQPPDRVAFVDRLLSRVRALPGVESAGVVFALPMGGADADAGFLIEGRDTAPPNRNPVAWYRPASPDYFSTLRMKLVRGRFFEEREDAAAPPVVLINETAAERYWPNADPLLSRVRIGGAWRSVVGIVADTRHFGLDREDRPAMYFPYRQLPLRSLGLLVRSRIEPESLASGVKGVLLEIDPEMALSDVSTLEDALSADVASPRMTMALVSVFALLAASLAAIGLYGVLSYHVGQKSHEIGIRMALGAGASEVLRSTVGRGMMLLASGTALGLAAAVSFSRFLSSLLFGVEATDPTAFLAATVVLAVVAFLASYLPARRAARVDPVEALRYE
jgi:putative ABC transport system permease protein